MGWFDNLFGGGQEQAGKDMYNQMQQGWQNAQGMMNPYIQRGNTAYQAYIDALNQSKDPAALYNQFASGYKESPEALAQLQVGQKNANNAAAAGGMLGSGAEQTAAASLAQSTRASDFDKYMQNMYNTRSQYLGGQQGLEGQGFNASNNLMQQMQKYFEDMAKAKGAQDVGRGSAWQNAALTAGSLLFGNNFGGGSGGGGSGGGDDDDGAGTAVTDASGLSQFF